MKGSGIAKVNAMSSPNAYVTKFPVSMKQGYNVLSFIDAESVIEGYVPFYILLILEAVDKEQSVIIFTVSVN